jgi:hypothetical protein
MKYFLYTLITAALVPQAEVQLRPQLSNVSEYRRAHEIDILQEFVALLSIPNVAYDGGT